MGWFRNKKNKIIMNLQEQISRMKSMMSLVIESKYENYKKNWDYVGSSYTDFDINEPLSVSIYLFPNEKGFLVELFYNNSLVGEFHSFVDEEEGQMNDIEIKEDFQGKGLGKILLLVSINVSNNYLGFFQSDPRGLTKSQEYVYKSLNNVGILKNWNEINYDEAQNFIDKITKEL